MVSWGTSFYKGFVILLWCTVWGIIGGIVAVALGLGSFWVNLSQPSFWQTLLRNPQYIWIILTESLVGFLIGGIIAFIGQFASFFKVIVDGATGEVEKLKNELTELKEDVTRRIAKDPMKIDEVAKDLEKKIQEARDKTAEEINKTRETLTQLQTRGGQKRNLSYDENLEKFKVDLANRIVEQVNKNSGRETALTAHFGEARANGGDKK